MSYLHARGKPSTDVHRARDPYSLLLLDLRIMFDYTRIALQKGLLNDNHQTAEQSKNVIRHGKCRKFLIFLFNFRQPKIKSCAPYNTPGHSLRILEASWKLPRRFR